MEHPGNEAAAEPVEPPPAPPAEAAPPEPAAAIEASISADATAIDPDAPQLDGPGPEAAKEESSAEVRAEEDKAPSVVDAPVPISTEPAGPVGQPPEPEPVAEPVPIAIPAARDVGDLDWAAIRSAADPASIRARIRSAVDGMEALLDQAGGPGLLFDADRTDAGDRAIRVGETNFADPLWIIGDLHGDVLALEAALAVIRREAPDGPDTRSRIVLLGDLFDDEGFGLEVLLRVFELAGEAPGRLCVLAGNHDEALTYDGVRFGAGVSPADFADFLNANLAHEWIERAGKLAVRFFANAPRAIFLPDGLLVAHGGSRWPTSTRASRRRAIGTIPPVWRISFGPGPTRPHGARCRTASRAGASSDTRILRPFAR
jgi:hypothetical protein